MLKKQQELMALWQSIIDDANVRKLSKAVVKEMIAILDVYNESPLKDEIAISECYNRARDFFTKLNHEIAMSHYEKLQVIALCYPNGLKASEVKALSISAEDLKKMNHYLKQIGASKFNQDDYKKLFLGASQNQSLLTMMTRGNAAAISKIMDRVITAKSPVPVPGWAVERLKEEEAGDVSVKQQQGTPPNRVKVTLQSQEERDIPGKREEYDDKVLVSSLHANPPDQAIEERFKKLSAEMQLMIQAMDLLVSELKDLEKNHQGVASHNKDLLSNYKTVVGEFQDINSIDHQQRMRQKIKREHRKYSNLQVNVIVANKILKSLTDLNRKLPELKQQFESVIKAKSTESLRSA
jgi:hypothetical protein